jgi:UDP-2-acetamido-3-amino-2,3-dideoxy-glucuronate N-acetyltransferase
MIHPLSDCKNHNIPESTNIWQFCVIFPNAQIGENCNICSHCLIENEVKIGNNCTVKCGVQLWDGIELEDNVIIGANTTFTNDLYPRAKNKDWNLLHTKICKGASIGAGSVILPGLTIGSHAMIGAGSVVTKNIPKNTIWIGNPAQMNGYITQDNVALDLQLRDKEGNVHNVDEIDY